MIGINYLYMKKNGFERKVLPNGDENPKYIDLLDEDKPIAGQKFACISFVSPEKLIKQKNLFYFNEFLKHWDFTKSVQKFTQFLNFISFKYNMNFDKIMEDFGEYTKSEKDTLTYSTINDDWKNFLDAKESDLEKQFNAEVDFQTNTQGVKLRGNFPTQQEAELRAKLLREVDPHHDIGICPVGVWVPVNPEAYRTGRVEYLEEELNQLMKEKKTNEDEATRAFEKRVKEAKTNAIEENKKLAKASGNKLTQNIDAEGNLIGVGTTETNLPDNASSADIRKELFEGDNIRTRATEKAKKEANEKANEEAENQIEIDAENMKVEINEKI
jgi:hypothetical protein